MVTVGGRDFIHMMIAEFLIMSNAYFETELLSLHALPSTMKERRVSLESGVGGGGGGGSSTSLFFIFMC